VSVERPAQPQPANPAIAVGAGQGASKPHQIQIEMLVGADPNVVWDQYLTSHRESPDALRDAVRRLNGEKKFDHVIALINAALRHQQSQPWMYEGLALAMQMAGRPNSDVERALMSAADFAQNPSELLYLAVYLSESGFDARAIKMLRQVAQIDPVRPEPYTVGLKLAERTGDNEAIKWASLEILRRAWPKDQQETRLSGERAANAILEKLKAENRTAEFNAFQEAVKQAKIRDCAVAVTWTGEGEVDLCVQEPAGTVCSFRSPRTTAGGVLLGDTLVKSLLPGGEGHSQVYVCPEGFSGGYKLLARRVWGKITSNKVNVLVYTHFGSKQQKVIQKRIPLESDEAVVAFDLDRGRRKESLQDQQVATAVAGQVAIGQQVLAQQLAAAVDPQALAAAANAQQNLADVTSGATTTVGGGNGTETLPVLSFVPLQGAVGYQPIIVTLPSGANTMFSAVVSADRRYVRITTLPMFSSIPVVHTFNFNTGVNTTGSGGTSSGFSGF